MCCACYVVRRCSGIASKDQIHVILREGFSSGHVDLRSNKYGASLYLARDPCLAHFLVRDLRERHRPRDSEGVLHTAAKTCGIARRTPFQAPSANFTATRVKLYVSKKDISTEQEALKKEMRRAQPTERSPSTDCLKAVSWQFRSGMHKGVSIDSTISKSESIRQTYQTNRSQKSLIRQSAIPLIQARR